MPLCVSNRYLTTTSRCFAYVNYKIVILLKKCKWIFCGILVDMMCIISTHTGTALFVAFLMPEMVLLSNLNQNKGTYE